MDLVGKVMSLLFNMLSRLVIAFLPRRKHLLISWLQPPSAVILEPPKIKSLTVSTVSPSICHEVMGPDAMILVFWMLSFKQLFHSPLSLSSRDSLTLLCFNWGQTMTACRQNKQMSCPWAYEKSSGSGELLPLQFCYGLTVWLWAEHLGFSELQFQPLWKLVNKMGRIYLFWEFKRIIYWYKSSHWVFHK